MSIRTVALILTMVMSALTVHAQASPALQFEIASVRQNTSDAKPSMNFPIGPGDIYSPTNGAMLATNVSLLRYILFAYKVNGNQEAALEKQLPAWVRSDRFDIQAKSDRPKATKDDMRLMMRALLAERFGLKLHQETQQLPVYAVVLAKPDKTGPRLRAHAASEECSNQFSFSPLEPGAKPPPEATDTGFPFICGGILGMDTVAPGRIAFGARNMPMSLIATSFTGWGSLGRPVIDQTGLTGLYDFALEFTPDTPESAANPDASGPAFQRALLEQLGLKLIPQKGPVEVLIVDHIEHPSAN